MVVPIIEKANITDLPALNIISLTSKQHWNYPKEWVELWKEDLKLQPSDFEGQEIYKLLFESKIIGFCAIQKQETNFEINHLWVLPDFIGKGFGKLLLNETIKKVVKKDAEIIVVADPNAEPFYASQGFKTFDKFESFPKGRYLPIMKCKI